MLRAKVKDLKELMGQVKTIQSNQERYKRTSELHNLVKEKLAPIQKEIAAIRLVQKTYPNQWRLPSVGQTLSKLKSLIRDLEHDPKTRFGEILRLIEPVQRDAKHQWPDIIKKQHHDSKRALITFSRIRKQDPEIERLIKAFDSLEKAWPVNEKNLDDYRNVLEDARQYIANLGAGTQVEQFLEKMAAGKATLDDMNEDVLRWIRAQGLTSQINITFK